MNAINGVAIRLFCNGLEIHPQSHYLGTFNAGDSIEMRMVVEKPKSGNRILITTNRDRQNPKLLVERSTAEGNYFEHTVPVIPGIQGTKFDRDDADKNCVHVVDMSSNGLVSVTNIVISGQEGEFFLVSYPTYVAQAYRSQQGVAIPSLWVEPGFPELVPFVQNNYRRLQGSLPSIEKYEPEGDIKPEVLEIVNELKDENHLVVKFWSVRTGTGGALRKRSDGEIELVKLYWKNLNVADRCPRHLLETEVIHAQGFRRTRSGRIANEAIGITREQFNAVAASS